jgi:hypothetical protein
MQLIELKELFITSAICPMHDFTASAASVVFPVTHRMQVFV